MYIQFFGAVMIIAAAYLWGNEISSRYRRRVQNLEELVLTLEMFLTEIRYGLTPLPRVFEELGHRVRRPVGNLFCEAAALMKDGEGHSALECWKKAAGKYEHELCFMPGDLQLLEKLGKVWGKGDKEGQARQVALVQELFRQALEEARLEQHKNEKIWKYLGLLGGMTLVIFLI